jgi:hypothetical protein
MPIDAAADPSQRRGEISLLGRWLWWRQGRNFIGGIDEGARLVEQEPAPAVIKFALGLEGQLDRMPAILVGSASFVIDGKAAPHGREIMRGY